MSDATPTLVESIAARVSLPPPRLIFYPIPQATTGAEAIARAARLCRCVRKSFAGIRWREGQAMMQMTWGEVDAAMAGGDPCAS